MLTLLGWAFVACGSNPAQAPIDGRTGVSDAAVPDASRGYGPVADLLAEDAPVPDAPVADAVPPSDTPSCGLPMRWAYNRPGCGAEAPGPICVEPTLDDACLQPACGCDGATLTGCSFYLEPFSHVGASNDGGADGARIDAMKDG